jgi:hypothetical protein
MTPHQTMKALCEAKAEQMWAEFNDNEKAGVRFGMFPAKPMQAADAEGFDGRLLASALMDVASKNGGMRA